jgi:hypothetical protein
MLTSHPQKRYRCRFCGLELPAWLPVAKRPEGSMLLYHLGQDHLKAVGPYLRRMETEAIDRVLSELFEGVEENETW